MKRKCLAVGIILLLIGICIIPVTAQEQPGSFTQFKLEFPGLGLYYYVLPFADYKLLRNWNAKSFPNVTAMFIGGGVGILPFLNVSIVLSGMYPDLPGKLDVYSDGEYYDTLYPEFWGPISARFYHLIYYEKGFHSLKFVAEDNTSLALDVQIGWRGFINNIFPYLIKVPNELTTLDNHPPDKPKITGSYIAKPHIPYECKIRAIDIDGDNVSYQVDWGDDVISEWTGWYPSGEEILQCHNYSKKGHVLIKARAKDIHDAIGEWGYITFDISRNTQRFLQLLTIESLHYSL